MKRFATVMSIGIDITIGLLLFCTILGVALGELSRPLRFEFPAGYRGWAQVFYEVPGCPPLPTKGLYVVIPVNESGVACTSSSVSKGWRITRFEYVKLDGTRTQIEGWGRERDTVRVWEISHSANTHETCLFVGTEDEFREPWDNSPCFRTSGTP
jgi:hypothetical protein